MAFQRTSKKKLISELNITPLVDVMLVLLVIFMVATPLMVSHIPLDLPPGKGASSLPTHTVLSVTLQDKGAITLEYAGSTHTTELAKLSEILPKILPQGAKETVVRASRTLFYGEVTQVLSSLYNAGCGVLNLEVTPS